MTTTLTGIPQSRTPEQDAQAYELEFGQSAGCPFDNIVNCILDARGRLAQALTLALLRFGVPTAGRPISIPAKIQLLVARVQCLPGAPRQAFEEGLARCRLAVQELDRLAPFNEPDRGVIWLRDYIGLLDQLVAATTSLEVAVQKLEDHFADGQSINN